MFRYLIFFTLYLSLFSATQAQNVLDAPFIPEKVHIYEPSAERYNWLHDYAYRSMTEEEKRYIKNTKIYLTSYLYAEPEYVRVRVMRTVSLEENANLGKEVDHSIWSHNGDFAWKAESGTNVGMRVVLPEHTGFNTHVPNIVQGYTGVNFEEILSDTSWFSQEKHDLQSYQTILNHYIDNGHAKMNSQGEYEIFEPFIPEQIEIISFQDLITRYLLVPERPSAWSRSDFLTPLSKDSIRSLFGADGKSATFTHVKVMEDYYIDPKDGTLTSYIIGLGFIGEGDVELCWIYFPALRWDLYEKCVIFQGKVTNYEYLLDNHMYLNTVDSIWPIGGGHLNNDDEFMVELDALLGVELRREENSLLGLLPSGNQNGADLGFGKSKIVYGENGEASGLMEVLHSNNKVRLTGEMVSGKCEGEFTYYHNNGSKKAIRNFKNGKLDGNQVNYWPNGNVYADYEISDGQVQRLTRWHEDGTLLEQGQFKNRIMHGVWKYRLYAPNEYVQIVETWGLDHNLPAKIVDGLIEYSVEYTHTIKSNCSYTYGRICLSKKVLK